MSNPLKNSFEIIPGKLYYVPVTSKPEKRPDKHFFCIDKDLIYWNFFLDFGPLNLGHLYRYCQLLNNKLSDPKLNEKVIYHFSGNHPHKRANAAFLICGWQILYMNKLPEEAYAPFVGVHPPFPPWHDATPGPCYFNLTVLHTLQGLYKAHLYKFFDLDSFDVAEYEHYEQVENGDLNWCQNGKFIAFAGPQATKEAVEDYYTLTPDDYIPYFKKKNVTLVVRFNKKYYDSRIFTRNGIDHADLYYLDGTNPPDHILAKFLQLCEETPGVVAVHCKAGLGRTGTCIGCYMMKHFRMTAEEAIGWLRHVRPGSVIGPQQQYMKDMQMKMWREGDLMREREGDKSSSEIDSALAHMTLEGAAANRRLQEQRVLPAAGEGKSSGTPSSGQSSSKTQGDYLRSRRMQAKGETKRAPQLNRLL